MVFKHAAFHSWLSAMLEAQYLDCMSFVLNLRSDVMSTSVLPMSCERTLSPVIKDVRKFMSRHPGLKEEECEEKK